MSLSGAGNKGWGYTIVFYQLNPDEQAGSNQRTALVVGNEPCMYLTLHYWHSEAKPDSRLLGYEQSQPEPQWTVHH